MATTQSPTPGVCGPGPPWEEAVAKLPPHAKPEGAVPLREDIAPERWHPTPREYNHAISKLKRNKAADAGGWATETAQSCMEPPPPKTGATELDPYTRHCYFRSPPGGEDYGAPTD